MSKKLHAHLKFDPNRLKICKPKLAPDQIETNGTVDELESIEKRKIKEMNELKAILSKKDSILKEIEALTQEKERLKSNCNALKQDQDEEELAYSLFMPSVSQLSDNNNTSDKVASKITLCQACKKEANFMCSACRGAHYCSIECQVIKNGAFV